MCKADETNVTSTSQGKNVMYINDAGDEMTSPRKMHDVDMHAAQAWQLMYAKPFEDPGYTSKETAVLANA